MAMAAVAEDAKKMITLKSSYGEEFEVEEAVAMESQTIRHTIEDDCADNGIPLPNVNSKILSKVIEYCNKLVLAAKPAAEAGAAALADGAATPAPAEDHKNWDAEFVKVDQATLFDLILDSHIIKLTNTVQLSSETVHSIACIYRVRRTMADGELFPALIDSTLA